MSPNQSSHDPEAQRFANHLNELAERAARDQAPIWTDFLEPPQQEQAKALLSWSAGIRQQSFGGYPKAERRRLTIFPDYYILETIKPNLAFIELDTSDQTGLEHRDYLGALLALGIKREKLGDILVQESGAQVILVPELVPFIQSNLLKVGNTSSSVRLIEAEQLTPPNQREKEIRTTVASLRLDALAALGMSESRTKMAREIKAERVKVNWQTVHNPDHQLVPGDVISVRGRGRLVLRELSGRSKKGRIGVVLVRYL